MKIKEYRETFSPPSRPDRRTVLAWARAGHIYSEKRGGLVYVDPDRAPNVVEEAEQSAEATEAPRLWASDNDLVRQVLDRS